jgi:glycosyltransferase involved in cell wall biosynthesis
MIKTFKHKKKILFISHDGSRTGAPLVLLNLLNYIKDHTQINCALILLNGGSYSNEFSEAVNGSMVIGVPKGGRLNRLKFYLRAFIIHYQKPRKFANPWKIFKGSYDFVYANTIVSASFGYQLSKKNNTKFILHLHEHDYSKKAYYRNWNQSIDYTSVFKFIAVSNYSKRVYSEYWNLPLDKLTVVNEFINIQNIKTPTRYKADIRTELSLQANFVVGGCGVGSWRKGFDIFISLCKFSKKHGKSWDFLWVGGISNDQLAQLEYEQNRMEIGNLFLTGETDSPQNYLNILDVFVLTSREDPFPLVCLEAATLEKPIVLFDDVGGMTEFVETDAGITVPYCDLVGMFEALIYLEQNPEEKQLLGKRAAEKVNNYDVNVLAPKILTLFEI